MDVGFVRDHLNQDPTVSLCVAGVMGGGELGTSWLCRKSGVLVSTIMLREVNSKLTEPFMQCTILSPCLSSTFRYYPLPLRS